MPDIGDFKDVAVIEVLVKPGDKIAVEQSLITVESDKASMEIPSSAAGVLKELKVKVGTAVKWTNDEKRTSHSIFFTGPGGFESERIFPGESWQRIFDKPGTYVYTCGPHPEMKGRIEVTE